LICGQAAWETHDVEIEPNSFEAVPAQARSA